LQPARRRDAATSLRTRSTRSNGASVPRRSAREADPAGEELGRLLDKATPRYRPLLPTAAFTGLRLSELLGLVWGDVDFEAGVVRVRKQLGRDGQRVEPKTPQVVRDVVLAPRLGTILREHKLSLPPAFTGDDRFVFPSGPPLYWRNVSARGLDKAAQRAGLGEWIEGEDGKRRWKSAVRMHDLRHLRLADDRAGLERRPSR
jgi:integrase